MVCLNKYISFDRMRLKQNLPKKINESIRLEFDFYLYNNNELKNIFDKIYEHINNKTKELFSDNHFIYLNMNNNLCSHMFKKGKREGHFCCKNITINGNKDTYVCTKHNKDHISKKRNRNTNNKIHEIFKKSKNSKKYEKNISNPQDIHKLYNRRNKNKIKKRKPTKIFIGNSGSLDLYDALKRIL